MPTPAVPNLPRGTARLDAQQRTEFAQSFQRTGTEYDAVRPGYPDWVAEFLLGPTRLRRVADIGAGTGLFTRDLIDRAQEVIAVEPSASMRGVLAENLPQVAAVEGTGESTGLEANSVDAVTVAQAWHWIDREAGTAEALRILRPGGVLGLVWNQLDTDVPWVHRLARIMHSGDVQRDAERAGRVGTGFLPAEVRSRGWEQDVTPEILVQLCHSRSYWLRAAPDVRATVDANLHWYLHEHLGFTPGQHLQLPYVTLAVRYVAATPSAPITPQPQEDPWI